MSVYLAFLRAAFQQQFAYRVANWAGLFTNTFFMFFRAYVLEACYAARSEIGGMDVRDATTYAVVSQALIMVAPQWGRIGVSESVRDGRVATELLRPVDYFGMHMAQRLGASAYYLLVRATPVLLIGAAAGLLAAPASLAALPALALSVVLGAWIAICVLFLIELSSFWLESDRGVRYLVTGVTTLASGLILPLHYYPDWAQAIAAALPFRYTLYLPVEIWTGQIQGAALGQALAVQATWVFAMWALCAIGLRRGTQKLVIHGG